MFRLLNHFSRPFRQGSSSRFSSGSSRSLLPASVPASTAWARRSRSTASLSLSKEETNYWGDVAQQLHWNKPFDKVFEGEMGLPHSRPHGTWFPGGELNMCYNAVDRHVESGMADQTALIYDSPVTGTVRKYSYRQVQDEVVRIASSLIERGVEAGDRVVLYMPMIPETVFSLLACSRIGAIHSVVFGGFAAQELATRITDCNPKVVLSASCGIEGSKLVQYKPLLDSALVMANHRPTSCLIYQRPQHQCELVEGRDEDWVQVVQGQRATATSVPCRPMKSTDPLYILYTSGTTGQPKGIVRDLGGHAVVLNHSMSQVYGVNKGETWFAASDIGWVVGHSYIVYAPLLAGCTTVLYEGKPVGTPDPSAYWRLIAEHKIVSMFTAPTAFRAIRQEDPHCKLIEPYRERMSQWRGLFIAGERCDPPTLHWAEKYLRVPVYDNYWQTETGSPITSPSLVGGRIPPPKYKPGSAGPPVNGWKLKCVDGDGVPLPADEHGHLVAELPLPPGMTAGLWNSHRNAIDTQRFSDLYLTQFPGYYNTGDAGSLDAEGFVYVMTRTDDVINVAGHRLSTGAMEEVLTDHPEVVECAVFGVKDSVKGHVPIGLVVLRQDSTTTPEQVEKELQQMVRDRIGPVAFFKKAAVVNKLPKTRSGKILRGTLRSIADGRPYKVPATIEDASVLEEVAQILRKHMTLSTDE